MWRFLKVYRRHLCPFNMFKYVIIYFVFISVIYGMFFIYFSCPISQHLLDSLIRIEFWKGLFDFFSISRFELKIKSSKNIVLQSKLIIINKNPEQISNIMYEISYHLSNKYFIQFVVFFYFILEIIHIFVSLIHQNFTFVLLKLEWL